MKIMYVYSDIPEEWNCSEFRAFIPARALAKAGHDVTLVFVDWWANQKELEKLDSVQDIIVLQRNAIGMTISRIMNTVMKLRVPILLDLDDDYRHMPETLKSYPFWIRGQYTREDNTKATMKYPPIKQIEWASKIVSGISSPSSYILDDWSEFTPNLYLLPNYVKTQMYTQFRIKKNRKPGDMIWIGWGGSASHKVSFWDSKAVSAIRKILTDRKDVGFILATASEDIQSRFFHPSYRERLKFVKWTDHPTWAQTLSSFDIGIIPLVDPYDTRRSWLKPLEYGLMGIPWVGSNNPMLVDLMKNCGVKGLLADNKTDSWYDHLINLINDVEMADALGAENIAWAEEQDVDLNVNKLADTLASVKLEIW